MSLSRIFKDVSSCLYKNIVKHTNIIVQKHTKTCYYVSTKVCYDMLL